MTRRALVHRISANAPDDVSGIAAAIASKQIDPAGVIAVLAKTEGNGLVNDFSRGHATLALSLLFQRHLPAQQAAQICLVMSGGTEGAMAPHWLVFEAPRRREGCEGRLHRPCPHGGAPIRASRPIAAGRSGGGRRARCHGGCRYR
jgi:ring-opening amidohydrolase-like protein